MANIHDYLDWRGDLEFSDFEINEIDELILARVSYFPYDRIKMKPTEKFKDIAKKMESFTDKDFIWKGDKELLQKLGESKRYDEVTITDYIKQNDLEEQKQFSAITIHIANNLHYVSYCGTDYSLYAWKENFNMSFMDKIPAQIEAKKYFDNIAKTYKGRFILGGHSKGGNLAIYAAVKASKRNKARIIKAINYDGPGFRTDFVKSKEYKEMLPKLHEYIPQDSIVGMLLTQDEKFTVVLSVEKAILQHDIFSWLVEKDKLISVKNTTKASQIMSKAISNWIKSLSLEQRQIFIDSVYEVLYSTEATSLKELSTNWVSKVGTVLKTYNNLSEKDKKIISKTVKQIITSYRKAVRDDNKKELKQKIDKLKKENKIINRTLAKKVNIGRII